VTDTSPWYTKAAWAMMTPFTKSPVQGAQTSIYLASSPEVAGVSGKYFDNCKPISSNAASYDTEVAKRLFEVSAELVGLKTAALV